MSYKKRWSDEDIIRWAEMFIARKMTLMEMEIMIGVSHSTLWWCFTHRLPRIDVDLYDQIGDCFEVNTHFKKYKEGIA